MYEKNLVNVEISFMLKAPIPHMEDYNLKKYQTKQQYFTDNHY